MNKDFENDFNEKDNDNVEISETLNSNDTISDISEISKEETFEEDTNTVSTNNSAELPVENVSSEPETNYNPQSDSFTYVGKDNVNGCVWDKTKKKKTPKQHSSKGFKIFVASMLTVFTVSAVMIATFMTLDYLDQNSDTQNYPKHTASSYNPDENITKVASKFQEVETGYTKSMIAAKCAPSTVGIVVEFTQSSNSYYDFGIFGNYYSTPQTVKSVGSGFIYNSNGYIITNHHVVESADKITVHLYDKTEVEAELIGSDSLSDIAVIKINPDGLNLVPMDIGNSDKLVVGDEVIAIGCPAGIEYIGTVTDGIISAINRDVILEDNGIKKTMTLLQTNATINKGNSGGPLINAFGEVIGINTLKLSSSYEGIGFSIPINGAKSIISQLIEHGKVVERSEDDFVYGEGVIGISASAISESEAEYYDIPMGVLVVQIDKESSAAKAGLRRGDIITHYNGTAITTVQELNSLKAKNKAGDEVVMTIYRDDDSTSSKTFEITFKLDAAK